MGRGLISPSQPLAIVTPLLATSALSDITETGHYDVLPIDFGRFQQNPRFQRSVCGLGHRSHRDSHENMQCMPAVGPHSFHVQPEPRLDNSLYNAQSTRVGEQLVAFHAFGSSRIGSTLPVILSYQLFPLSSPSVTNGGEV